MKIAIVNFGGAEGGKRLMQAVQRLATEIAYEAWLTVASMDELIHTLEQHSVILTSKTIAVTSHHALPPGRNDLRRLLEPDKPIQIIVVNSPGVSKQAILFGAQAVVLAVEGGAFRQLDLPSENWASCI